MVNLENIEEAFEKMHHRYETVFSIFRPSRKKVGFSEANLTHNFVNALKGQLLESELVEWLEFPWGHEGSYRIDGIVVSKKEKWIMYIEAKKFQDPKQVIKLNSDLKAIQLFCKNQGFGQIFLEQHIIDISEYEHYMIAIADVWTKEKYKNWKKNMPSLWMNHAKFEDMFPECGLLSTMLRDGMSYVQNSKVHPDYHQLCAVKKFEINGWQ